MGRPARVYPNLAEFLKHSGKTQADVAAAAGVSQALIQKETTVRLDWISETMRMGERSSCCRTIRRTREMMQRRKDWIEVTRNIRGMSISHD